MASIDFVIASFAASLAIAGGSGPLDLEMISGGIMRKSSQSFLLGKILTSKPCDSSLVKSHFQWIWILEKKVKVQEKGTRFLFSFESFRDKKKVLRVPMWHVRYWVKIEGIPPAIEEPENFKLIGDLLRGFLDYDKALFKQGVVRVFLQYDVSIPIFLSIVIRLVEGVKPLLHFTFEHLVGRCKICKHCGLISHIGEQCLVLVGEDLAYPSSAKLSGFGSTDLVLRASFVFASQIPRAIGSSLFRHVSPIPPMVKECRTIVI
ncbi:hypothetical protein M0R45_035742 [Rubus argutus]|uniref:DUF4283 domain-containing protein n=1 Tax=Rubus argutus TaxID=59490 RepID=A0AAW1VU10_RUBAR